MSTESAPPDEPGSEAEQPARRRRPWYVRLAFLGVVLVVCVLLAEVVLAVSGKVTIRRRDYVGEHESREHTAFVADETIGWRMRPGIDITWEVEGVTSTAWADDDGFRHDPEAPPADPGKPYVALTGDSYMWGTGVPWAESCAGRIAATGGYRVRNFAMPGFGVDQIALTARHVALPTEPDALVIAPFLGDFDRSFTAFRPAEGFTKPMFRLDGEGKLVQQTAADRPGFLFRLVEDHSHIFGLWRRAQRGVGLQRGVGDWWQLNEALLRQVRDDCEERGVELLIVHIPSRWGTPFPALEAAARDWGVGFVALSDMTEDERRTGYYQNDGHLNAAGHAYLAGRITEWLDSLDLGAR